MSIDLKDLKQWSAARTRLSPNFNARRSNRIEGIVLHHTGGTDEGSESWMEADVSNVSCHLHFRRDGSTTRMVDDAQRAWHAGAGVWRGKGDVNSRTLGWEIGNFGDGREKYTDAQYAELAHVAAHYIRQGLTLDDFISHDELDGVIGGGRKNDPHGFDWERFRKETRARLSGEPIGMLIPHRVWSDYFGEYLVVIRVVSDSEWYFLPESVVTQRLPELARASTPLSHMPLEPR